MKIVKRNLGKFYIENRVKDGEGTRILRQFLLDIIIEIAASSRVFIKYAGHPPYVYREKQLHTVVAPAIAKTSETFLMESPVEREWSSITNNIESNSHGWVDYWCLFKGYNYYIELKHGYISYRSNTIRQQVKEEWQVACNQLNVIQKDIDIQKEISKGIFKVALHVLPIYVGSKREDNWIVEEDTLLKLQKLAMKDISENMPANWSCMWRLHSDLVDTYKYTQGFESYPAVLFLANISEIEKR